MILRQKLLLIFALVFASLGLMMAWRALRPSTSALPTPPDSSATAIRPDVRPPGGVTLPVSLLDVVSADSAPNVARRLRSHFESHFHSDSVSCPPDEASLLEEIENIHTIYFAGSFEGYLERLERTGANSPLLSGENAQLNAQIEFLWRHNVSAIAEQPISIQDAIVRARYIDGRDLAPPDLGAPTWFNVPDRYPIASDPQRGKLTVYEFLVPVMYHSEEESGPVWWGVWVARSPQGGPWQQTRSVIYAPIGVNVAGVPIF